MKKIILWLFALFCGFTTSVFGKVAMPTPIPVISNSWLISRINQEFGNKNWWEWVISSISSVLPDQQWAIISFNWSWVSYTWVIWVSSENNNQLINSYLVNGSSTLLYSNKWLQVEQYSVQNNDLIWFYITFWAWTKVYKLLWTWKKNYNTWWLEKLNSATNQSLWRYLLTKSSKPWTETSICQNKNGFYKNIWYEWITYKFILKKNQQLFAVNPSWNIIEFDCWSTITKDYELPLGWSTTIVWGWDNFFLLNNTINKKTLSQIFNISTNTITPLHLSIKNIWKFSKEKISWCIINSQQWDILQITCTWKKLTYKWVYNVKNMQIVKVAGK